MRKSSSLPVALAVALVVAAAPVASANDDPAVGSVAPGFTLADAEGRSISLSDFRGKWVVLYFYPGRNCTTICALEARNFERDLVKYDKAGAVILGISVDTVQAHRDFSAKEGLNLKLLADPDARVSAEYGSVKKVSSLSARNTFIVDPDGKIARVFLKVMVVGHSETVLAALAELQKR